ncbi:hypothetical protein [Streptacidiphilus sp. PAMC 29251]
MGEKAPAVIRALAKGDNFSGALNAVGLSLSMKDASADRTGMGYFAPRTRGQLAVLAAGNLVPGVGSLVGPLAVGFENAWKHGSAEDRAAAAAKGGG